MKIIILTFFFLTFMLYGCSDKIDENEKKYYNVSSLENISINLTKNNINLEIDKDICYQAEKYNLSNNNCITEINCQNDDECENYNKSYNNSLEELDTQNFSSSYVGNHFDNSTIISEELRSMYLVNKKDELILVSKKSYKIDYEIWELYINIIPKEIRGENIISFGTFNDGKENTLAYVIQDELEYDKWILGIDYNDYENGDYNEFLSTIIHESAHILSLNKNQVDYENYENCNTYLIDEGCLKKNSYLFNFYDIFWKGEFFNEHNEIKDDEDSLYEFYEYYSDEFVTEYAASDPLEDFAESFTYFILKSKKLEIAEIKDEKINFFYQYPELVEVRKSIKNKRRAKEGQIKV